MAADIFVSFASKDVRVAMTLCGALENRDDSGTVVRIEGDAGLAPRSGRRRDGHDVGARCARKRRRLCPQNASAAECHDGR